MSLDGFIAGPKDGRVQPLGLRHGERLLNCYFNGSTPSKYASMFKPKGKNIRVVIGVVASPEATHIKYRVVKRKRKTTRKETRN